MIKAARMRRGNGCNAFTVFRHIGGDVETAAVVLSQLPACRPE
jgi:hypothetical protein